MPERELRPEEEPDGLEPLRKAWREFEPPDAFEALDAPDSQTRAVLAWLGAAWRAATPPPAALPWRLRLRRPRRLALKLAAAAILVAAFLAARRWASQSEEPQPGQDPVAQPASTSPAPSRQEIRVADLSEDRTEIRSGPVRLILFSSLPSDSLTDGQNAEEPR